MSVRVGSVMIIVISLLWGRILALNVQALPGHDPAVLVIGAAGIIGFHMIISTLSNSTRFGGVGNNNRDHREVALLGVDNFTPGYSSAYKRQRMWELIDRDVNFMEVDVCNVGEFTKLIEKFHFTHVVNFAEKNHVDSDVGYMDTECLHSVLKIITRNSIRRKFPTVYVYLRLHNFDHGNHRSDVIASDGYLKYVEVVVEQDKELEEPGSTFNLNSTMSNTSERKMEVAPVVSAITKVLVDSISNSTMRMNPTAATEYSSYRVRSTFSTEARQEDSSTTPSGFRNTTNPVRLPCASECSSPSDCLPSAYDYVAEQSKRITRNCDVVYYTVGLHRLQSTLKKVESSHMPTECCIAYIASESPLSRIEKSTYNGWSLIRLNLAHLNASAFGPTSSSARKASRLPKINPARFFSAKVRYAVYFDSSSTPTLDPREIKSFMFSNSQDSRKRASVVMFHHPTLMYYGGSAIRSAMEEAEAALPRSGTPAVLVKQKIAYAKASRKSIYRDELSYKIMPTALFIIWDLRSKTAHEFRCQWYDEYSLWGDRDQVSLFYTLASITMRHRLKTDVLQEWIPLRSPSTETKNTHGQLPHLRLLLGKGENYSPFFIKGEDDEKGYPKSKMNDG